MSDNSYPTGVVNLGFTDPVKELKERQKRNLFYMNIHEANERITILAVKLEAFMSSRTRNKTWTDQKLLYESWKT